jgi:predicted nucleic acid-binding protein
MPWGKLMPSDIHPIDSYTFTKDDTLLFDTNIWMYIYGPQIPRDPLASVYSDALKRILQSQSKIFMDVLILSEFINAYSRYEFNCAYPPGSKTDFKAYRKTPAYQAVAKAIADEARRILKYCIRTESFFEDVDIDNLLNDFENNCPDFNDQIFAELCKAKNLKLITHDRDFADSGLTILTANPRLLPST